MSVESLYGYHKELNIDKDTQMFVWESDPCSFNELIISWNACRPCEGAFLLQVSLLINQTWTSWINYAYWSKQDQYSFTNNSDLVFHQQDVIQVLEGKALAFKVKVMAEDGASLLNFRSLHASWIDTESHEIVSSTQTNIFKELSVEGLSQIVQSKIIGRRICSPTSTTAVIKFLLMPHPIQFSPVEFASRVFDSAFDIYGNWVLNIAQAAHELGEKWECFVAYLHSFDQIIHQLKLGYPVVVSIQGILEGGGQSYKNGHLIVIKGYDSSNKEVLCMDPAFPVCEETHKKYPLDQFLSAWRCRKGIAYLFRSANQ